MIKILIVEDDSDLRDGLNFSFKADGYKTEAVSTVQDAINKINKNSFDIIILDCNLPDGNGFDLGTKVHKEKGIPVLMLTARDSEMDEVRALELGIDDYMTKPFSLAVLKARIKKILNSKKTNILRSNGFVVDLSSCKVTKNEEEIELTSIELKLLAYMIENKGIVLSKEQILQHIWDSNGNFVDDNIVSVNIRRLRMKLEDNSSSPKYIKTIHGIGYIWKEV